MSGTQAFSNQADQLDVEYYQYKSVSASAIVGFVLAVFSLACFYFKGAMLLPVIGVVVSIYAVTRVRKYSDQLTGGLLAKSALCSSAAIFVSAFAFHTYIYLTEVPEGYQRINFAQLQPARGDTGPVPQRALELNGEKVFVKGYIYPGEKRVDLKTFILVPDMGTCCFGGQPKLTDMILVTLDDPVRADYSLRYRKLTGVFQVEESLKSVTGLGGVYYRLKGDGIK